MDVMQVVAAVRVIGARPGIIKRALACGDTICGGNLTLPLLEEEDKEKTEQIALFVQSLKSRKTA